MSNHNTTTDEEAQTGKPPRVECPECSERVDPRGFTQHYASHGYSSEEAQETLEDLRDQANTPTPTPGDNKKVAEVRRDTELLEAKIERQQKRNEFEQTLAEDSEVQEQLNDLRNTVAKLRHDLDTFSDDFETHQDSDPHPSPKKIVEIAELEAERIAVHPPTVRAMAVTLLDYMNALDETVQCQACQEWTYPVNHDNGYICEYCGASLWPV
jgi:DNA repair exonuclease SbcCD ATPase subunit